MSRGSIVMEPGRLRFSSSFTAAVPRSEEREPIRTW